MYNYKRAYNGSRRTPKRVLDPFFSIIPSSGNFDAVDTCEGRINYVFVCE